MLTNQVTVTARKGANKKRLSGRSKRFIQNRRSPGIARKSLKINHGLALAPPSDIVFEELPALPRRI
jgi:hypothetical protein